MANLRRRRDLVSLATTLPGPCLPLGIRLARRAQHAEAGAALLAVAFLAPLGGVAPAGADAAPAAGAVQQHVRDVDRHLLGEAAPLRVAPAGPHVPIDAVDA